MSAAKHTASPWIEIEGVISRSEPDSDLVRKPNGDLESVANGKRKPVGIPICRIISVSKNAKADAKLIAAAPELLEALQEMIELVDDLDHENAVSSHFAAYRKAQAAIQLATK